jgi:large subunit ribosomal protein L24
MKSEFSKTWNSSKQPRKQVKFRANAPNHIKRKFMGASLDKPLRESQKRRSIELVKGDEVLIMRGKFKGKKGKVGKVDVKNTRMQIEGVQRSKKGGEKVETWFHPSNVKIVALNDKDSRRFGKFKTATKAEVKEAEKTENKPEVKKK